MRHLCSLRTLRCTALLGVTLLWATLFFGSLSTAQQDSRERLEEQISSFEQILETRRTELGNLEAALSEVNTRLDAQLAERDRLSARIVDLGAQQGVIQNRTQELQRAQRLSAVRIAGLEARTERLKEQLQDLIVNLHKRRGGRNFGALAQTDSLFELRVKNYYLSRLTQQDVTLLETFNQTSTQLNRARSARAARVRNLRVQAQDLAANQSALETTQANLETVITELSLSRAGQLAQRETLLQEQNSIEANLTGTRGELAAELERQREEAVQLAAQVEAARQAATEEGTETDIPADPEFAAQAERLEQIIRSLDSPQQAQGGYALPFDDPVVVRPFGQDGATDIWLRASQPGSAVRAVKSGVVYRASLITANSGYTVALRHGPNLISAYTNLQAPLVEIGDRVEQGEILGYLGGGIIEPDILQLRLGRIRNFDIIYQDPIPLLGLGSG